MAKKQFSKALIARRYAQALFDLAHDGKKIEEVAKDLNAIDDIIYSSEEFSSVLQSPILPKDQVANAALAIFAKIKISELTHKFCVVLGANGRLSIMREIVTAYDEIMSQSKGEVKATVTSAKALKKSELKEITSLLSKNTGKIVLLEEEVDDSILGGLIVTIGSQMLDCSLSGKLESTKLYLKNAS